MRPANKIILSMLSLCWLMVLAASASAEDQLFVSPEVYDRLNHADSVELVVHFRGTPDLSPAYQMDWIERGRWVHETMSAASRDAQAGLRSSLRTSGIDYQALEAFNMVFIPEADNDVLQTLIADTQVRGIFVKPEFHLMGRELADGDRTGPRGTEPNIDQIKASDVWDLLGITGEDAVVGINDTSVRYTHDALVNQYRGNLGDGNFDHNYAWFDPNTGSSEPFAEFHGTHVTGIAIGDDGADNQIGVAPDAQWMACGGCAGGACGGVIQCLDWFTAPTDLAGDNPDPDQRPHVVNNSWGNCAQTHNLGLYGPIFDSMYAAGVIPVFSNGNNNAFGCQYPSPPGLNTVGDPARHGRVLGIGSTTQSGGNYAFHSNWGPTDHANPGIPDSFDHFGYPDLKPNVSVPGQGIRSANSPGDNSYTFATGTSMASPHAAGVIALMVSAAPVLAGDFQTIGTILQETANHVAFDGGGAGDPDVETGVNHPNYASGWGEIDVLAAVKAALAFAGPQGTIAGQVTSSDDSQPIADVLVFIENPNPPPDSFTAFTDTFGNYSRDVAETQPGEGTYTATFSRFGFESAVVTDIEVEFEQTTTVDVQLDPSDTWTVSGTVMDSITGNPLAATIEIPGTPIDPISVGFDGQYSVDLPSGMAFDLVTSADVPGYLLSTETVGPLTGDITFDIEVDADLVACEAPGYGPELSNVFVEDFDADDGGFTTELIGNAMPWEWGSPVTWPEECTVGDNCWGTNLNGNYATPGHERLVSPVYDLSAEAGAEVLFARWDQAWHIDAAQWHPASAEVSIDGGPWVTVWEHAGASVQQNWTELQADVTAAGGTTLQMRWTIESDSVGSFNGIYVDNLRVLSQECVAGDPPPVIEVTPDGFSFVVEPGSVENETITVRNWGGEDLIYNIEFLNTSGLTPRSSIIWEQEVNGTSGIVSAFFENEGSGTGAYSSDDFAIAFPTDLETILVQGFLSSATFPSFTSLNWSIYPDDGGAPAGDPEAAPGSAIWTHSSPHDGAGITITGGDVLLDVEAATGAELTLEPGHYWLVFHISQPTAVTNDRWNWFQGGPPQSEIAKIITPGSAFGGAFPEWTDLTEVGPEFAGLAFTLTGAQAGCDGTQPSWLTLDSFSGTVNPSEQDDIAMTVDTDGLADGTYQTGLCFESNDPENPLVLVPVNLLVTSDPIQPVADINPESLTFNQVAGDSGSQTLNMGNTGNLPLDWSIEQDPNPAPATTWPGGISPVATADKKPSGARGPVISTGEGGIKLYAEDVAQLVVAGGAGVPTLSVDGKTSDAEYDSGAPFNSTLELEIGVGNELTGIGWEVTIETVGFSWLSESRLAIVSNAGDTTGLFLTPGVGDNSAGTETYSSEGILVLDNGLDPIPANASGTIYLEWYESFVDAFGEVDAFWSDPAAGQVLPPGLRLICTDQAACDAAVSGPPPAPACEQPSNVSWLDVSPVSGTTPAFDSVPVNVTANSTGLAEGIHEASLCVTTNDPDNELVIVPITLEVIDPANVATVEGTVSSLGYCNDNPFEIAGAAVEIIGEFNTFNTTTDGNGFFQVEMHQQEGPVDVFVTADDHFGDSELEVTLAGETTSTVDFDLLLQVECATVDPESFEFEVVLGDTDSELLTIGNIDGNADLDWAVDHFEGDGTSSLRDDPEIVLSEDFEDAFPPAGWTVIDDAVEPCPWLSSDDYGMNGWAGEVGNPRGAAADDDACGSGAGPSDTSLITPSMDLGGLDEAQLTFDLALRTSPGTVLDLDVSTDGGDNWTNLESWTSNVAYPGEVSNPVLVDLSAYDGEPDVQLRWRYITTGWHWWVFVDNVVVQTAPPPPPSCENPNDVDWLNFTPASGTTSAGDSSDVTIGVETTGLEDGVYTATLCVTTSDANAELFEIPVSMTVHDPELATFTGTVTGQVCSEDPQPLEGALITIDGALEVYTTETDVDGHYFIKVHEDESPADVTVSFAGYLPETDDGVAFAGLDVIEQDYNLAFDSACVDVDPEELSTVVPLDETSDEFLNIGNLGSQTLDWTILDPSALLREESDPLIGFNLSSGAVDPQNWNRIGSASGTLEDVMDDTGAPTGVDITWGALDNSLSFVGTSTLAGDAVPQYDYDLSTMTGYGFSSAGRFFIELSGLSPNTNYEFWFVGYRASLQFDNMVDVSEGNDPPGAIEFAQIKDFSGGYFYINDVAADDSMHFNDLAMETRSSSDGTLRIEWESPEVMASVGAFAIRQALSCDIPDWLSISPMEGAVDTGEPADVVTATFDPTGLLPGVYEASICVESNDPATPVVEVPVTMTTEVPATWGSITGTVSGLGYCSADPSVLEGAVVEVVSSEDTYMLETDEFGFYEIYLSEDESPLTITASFDNHHSNSINVAFSGGDEVNGDIDLVLDEPCATVIPESISVNIDADASTNGNIQLGNVDGGAILNWTIDTADASLNDLLRPDPERATSGDKSDLLAEGDTEHQGIVLSSGSVSLTMADLADVIRPMSGGPTLSVDGMTTGGLYDSGNPHNSSVTLDIGQGNALLGIGWEVTIEAFAPSWLSESRLAIVSNAGDDTGLFLTPGFEFSGPGIETLSSEGVLILDDVDIPPIQANANGELYFEWHETFVDFPNDADSIWMDSDSPLVLPPGLRLICEDQAACDAAVGGEDNGGGDLIVECDDPEGISWLSATPSFGITNVGDTSTINVALDASGLQPGEYHAGLCIASNDPVNPMLSVPVTMNVRVPSNWATVEGTVEGLGYCGENPAALEGASVEVVGSSVTLNATTDASGQYSVSLAAAEGPVTVNVSHQDHLGDSEADVGLAAGAPSVVDFSLTEISGCTDHDPDSFSVTLVTGDNTTEALTLDNIGFGASAFSVTSVETTEEAELTTLTIERQGREAIADRSDDDMIRASGEMAAVEPYVQTVQLSGPRQEVNVLVVSPDGYVGTPIPPTNLVNDLAAFPDMNVDLFDEPDLGTITVADLEGYDVVVTTNNNRWSDAGADVAIGNALADFVDQGGHVIIHNFALDFLGWEMGGRYITEGYSPMSLATGDTQLAVTMDPIDPAHPIFENVTSVGYGSNFRMTGQSLNSGTEILAEWSDGVPMLAMNEHSVSINAMYSSDGEVGDWSGDLNVLVYNAVQVLVGPVGEPAEWLSFDPETGTVAAESSANIDVTFDAMGLAAGIYEANILVTLDEGGEVTLSIPATMEVIDPDPAELVVSPMELDFDAVLVGEFATLSFQVSNAADTGALDLALDTLDLTGHASFSISGGDCEAGVTVLEPGASCMVDVTFEPQAVGNFTGEVSVAGNGQSAEVDLLGEGFMLDPGALELSPASHDFGPVPIGTSSTTMLTLTNTAEVGSAAVLVDAIELVGDASFTDTGDGTCEEGVTELEPEESCTIEVTFAPTSQGSVATTLLVDGSDGKLASAMLNGEGFIPDPGVLELSPASHDFGPVLIGNSSTIMLTLSNTAVVGSDAVLVDAIELVGDASFIDTGVGTCEAGVTELEPEESCTIEVTFAPTSEGSVETTLLVDGSDGKAASAVLNGAGVEPTDELFHDRFESQD